MKYIFFFLAVLLYSLPAGAHIISGNSGFISGFTHPVLGLDHLLAMLSVGIISAQIGGRKVVTIPATFVILMVVGGILGFANITVPGTEYMLSFSVLALGFAIAASRNMPLILTTVFVAVFGFFHGYAHGIEMPGAATTLLYAAGFILGTASIHVAGIAIALIVESFRNGRTTLRYAGAVIAGMGLEMIVSIQGW